MQPTLSPDFFTFPSNDFELMIITILAIVFGALIGGLMGLLEFVYNKIKGK